MLHKGGQQNFGKKMGWGWVWGDNIFCNAESNKEGYKEGMRNLYLPYFTIPYNVTQTLFTLFKSGGWGQMVSRNVGE